MWTLVYFLQTMCIGSYSCVSCVRSLAQILLNVMSERCRDPQVGKADQKGTLAGTMKEKNHLIILTQLKRSWVKTSSLLAYSPDDFLDTFQDLDFQKSSFAVPKCELKSFPSYLKNLDKGLNFYSLQVHHVSIAHSKSLGLGVFFSNYKTNKITLFFAFTFSLVTSGTPN